MGTDTGKKKGIISVASHSKRHTRLLLAAEDMATMLDGVEWFSCDEVMFETCPRCLQYKRDGHESNCDLAALLSRIRGPQGESP